MTRPSGPLLSIVIPAYNRPEQLLFGLYRIIAQAMSRFEDELEIVVVDDASPGDALREVKAAVQRYSFVRFARNAENLGFERNLVAAASHATGEYLWILGDDDFIERAHGLDNVMLYLRARRSDVYVLNHTRRSADLANILDSNWMNLDPGRTYAFSGVREFCRAYGLISVLGLISVCMVRRQPFSDVDATKYIGTMYPQIGAIVEAFHDSPTLLIGDPIVCRRSPAAAEIGAEHDTTQGLAASGTDWRLCDATNSVYAFARMLQVLMDHEALTPDDLVGFQENTGTSLVDLLIDSIGLHRKHGSRSTESEVATARRLFGRLPLSIPQRYAAKALLAEASAAATTSATTTGGADERLDERAVVSTISVITPSFNQAAFLGECLGSVLHQTVAPIEHFVLDPGSTDGSMEVAKSYHHVTLISEPDRGQSDALNKGFQLASGDVIAWLNSDDLYADTNIFERVVARFNEPDAPDIVYGRGVFIGVDGRPLREVYVNHDPTTLHRRLQHEDGVLQPALFMRRTVIERVGLLRTDRHFTMDYDYWIRCVESGLRFAYLDENLALARYHRSNKTFGQRAQSYAEICDVVREHYGYVHHRWLRRYAEFNVDGHDGVLSSHSMNTTADSNEIDREHRRLLLAFNGSYDTRQLLTRIRELPGYGDTFHLLNTLAPDASTPCEPVPLDRVEVPGRVCYTVGPRRWAFDRRWKQRQIELAHQFLRERIARRESDVCVVVGNGPSLNQTNLSLLEGHDVIVSNNSFLSEELLRSASYFTVVNYLVAEQSATQINMISKVHKVVPYWLSYCLNQGDNTHFVDAIGHARFSTDMFANMSWRHTVTFFNLHLAYGLGYRRVVLIGMDHSYRPRTGASESDILFGAEDDVDHFSPAYFRRKRWQAADATMMEAMYEMAKHAFEEDGREIVNATVGGALELFRRVELSARVESLSEGGPCLTLFANILSGR